MTLNKPPSGHCGLKVQPMVGWCRVPYGGEGMLDGSKQGSGATLDNYERGSKGREYIALSGPKSIVD